MKAVRCRSVDLDCDGVGVAEHARGVRGVQEATPETAARVRSVMRDEPAEA